MPDTWYLEGFARYPQCEVEGFTAIGNDCPDSINSALPQVEKGTTLSKNFLKELMSEKKMVRITFDEALKEYLNASATLGHP